MGHDAAVWAALLSPDGRYVLTGSSDNTARLWDAATGKQIRVFSGHTQPISANGLAFSPDGKYVLTGSADKTARMWETLTGREIRRFLGHADAVADAKYSPDGKWVLTSSNDGTARFWRTDYRDSIRDLCAGLVRDFTDEERAEYEIKGTQSTCPGK